MADGVLYTIGHSNHELACFVHLLTLHQVTAVVDVRSSPFSRYNPQFNHEPLARHLTGSCGIAYVSLGRELGARREEPECFDKSGQVVFDRVAQTQSFQAGLARVTDGMRRYRLALMCAEKDPLTCHRTILICRHLRPMVSDIRHIRESGDIENHETVEGRLLRLWELPERDLFRSRDELLEEAYARQGQRIAWVSESRSLI